MGRLGGMRVLCGFPRGIANFGRRDGKITNFWAVEIKRRTAQLASQRGLERS